MSSGVECQKAVEILVREMHMLPHPGPGHVKLPHPGIVTDLDDGSVLAGVIPASVQGPAVRRLISEAVILRLEKVFQLVPRD